MEWTCPHCQIKLATPGLGDAAAPGGPAPGWAYARCFQCRGYAMIERESGKTRKVEKTARGAAGASRGAGPSPESGLSPESASSPGAASPRSSRAAPTPPPISAEALEALNAFSAVSADQIARATAPRPETPAVPRFTVSGAIPPEAAPLLERIRLEDAIVAEAPPQAVSRAGNGMRSAALLAAVAAILGTGALSLEAGRYFSSHFHPSARPPVQAARQPAAAAAASKLAAPSAPVASARVALNDDSDSIRSAAMAPTRPVDQAIPPPAAKAEARLSIQARAGIRALELRTGPGARYPLVGLADPGERYDVIEWSSHWYKVSLDDGRRTAWVPHQDIDLFSDDAPEGGADDVGSGGDAAKEIR